MGSHGGRWAGALCVIAQCAWLSQAAAQAREPQESGILSVIVENDFVGHLDRHYTSGLRVSWLAPGAPPAWLRPVVGALPARGEARVEYAIGQNMYTPAEIGRALPDPADRPYAGWLYGSIGLIVNGAYRLDQLQLTVGAIGPASGARDMQVFLHEVTGSREPRGWGSQLENELGVNLTYQHTWRAAAAHRASGMRVDLSPHLGGAVGNVHVYANAGLTVRFGRGMARDYGPPRMDPSLPGSSYFVPTEGFRWYLFAGVDLRAVARNLFLDGNSFRDSARVDKETWVGDVQGGIVLVRGNTRLGYTHVLRAREFKTQDSNHQFGALTVSIAF